MAYFNPQPIYYFYLVRRHGPSVFVREWTTGWRMNRVKRDVVVGVFVKTLGGFRKSSVGRVACLWWVREWRVPSWKMEYDAPRRLCLDRFPLLHPEWRRDHQESATFSTSSYPRSTSHGMAFSIGSDPWCFIAI